LKRVETVIRKDGDSIILHVLVQPKASEDRVVGFHGQALKVKVTAPPRGGKANQRLIEILAERLNVAKSQLEIIRGRTSRKKVVRIRHISPSEVRNKLERSH
jgi:uncharacterized protein (TIGR00251 family)